MKKRVLSTVVAFSVVCNSFAPIQAYAVGSEDVLKRDVQPVATVSLNTDKLNEDGANAAIKKDEAKAISIKALKEYMDYELDEKGLQSNIQYTKDYGLSGKYVWMISWNGFSTEKSVNINVGIDASTGKILSMNFYEYANTPQSKGVMKTQKEARKVADEFLKRINPLEYGQLEYIDDSAITRLYGGYKDTNYSLRYIRKVNNIPCDGNWISVNVDGTTGKVIGYSYNWNNDMVFPSATDVISGEEALEIYEKSTPLSLSYIGIRADKSRPEKLTGSKLAYLPGYTDFNLVSAKDGSWINWQGETSKEVVKKDLTAEERVAFLNSAKPREKLEGELESDKATKLVEGYMTEIFGTGYEVQNLNFSEGGRNWYEGRGKNTWTAQLTSTDKSQMYGNGGSITISADTGEILSFYKYNTYDDSTLKKPFTPSITWDQGYKKAIDILEKYYGDKLEQITTAQIKQESRSYFNGYDISNRQYNYNFPRTVNGLSFGENAITITIDAETGRISQVSCMWDEGITFGGKEKVITPEAAKKIYFGMYRPELSYVNTMKADGTTSDAATLAYVLKNKEHFNVPTSIDAETGDLLGYDGLKLAAEKNSFDMKIKGTKHERELSILAFQGVIDENSFQMNRAIKKGEFLKMFVNTRGQYYGGPVSEIALKFTNIDKTNDYYGTLQQAVSMGLVENKETKLDLNATLTREEMADIVIHFLKLEKMANAKGIYKLNYTDATTIRKASYGSVAVCKGLGIFDGTGKFRPKAKATMLEAALAVYKALDVGRP